MKQLVNTLFLFLVGMIFPFSGLDAQNGSSALKTVVIDAGHGGKDPGCIGRVTKEKYMTLKLALQFGKMIEASYPDINVVYTRTTDVFLPLDERADIANKNNADLFISIHCNAHKSDVSGTETFVMGLHKAKENLEVAKRENASILLEEDYEVKYQGFDPESNEGHIWLTMVQNKDLTQSISLANKIESEFQSVAKLKSRGVKQAGFVVLRLTTMPSVLIEAGFLSNKTEEAFVNSENGQYLLATSMFNAFSSYKHEMDRMAAPELSVQAAPKKESPVQSLVVQGEPQKAAKPPKHTTAKGVKPEPVVTNTITENDVWIPEPLTRPVEEALEYRVQLKASITPVNTNIGQWPRVENLVQVWERNRYKYLVTGFPSYTDALKGQNYWRENGFPDAFIVAYKNDKRVKMQTPPNP